LTTNNSSACDGDVSRETLTKLIKFEKLIINHNFKFNIIGKSTVKDIWKRHFADSAKIFNILKELNKSSRNTLSICDIGTGAGFPGLILAILNQEEKMRLEFTLIDSSKKKCLFLKDAIAELGINLKLKNKRAEELNKKYDVIMARALAPLTKIFRFARRISKKDTIYIFPKGKTWSMELEELKKKWQYEVNIVKNNRLIDESGGVISPCRQIEFDPCCSAPFSKMPFLAVGGAEGVIMLMSRDGVKLQKIENSRKSAFIWSCTIRNIAGKQEVITGNNEGIISTNQINLTRVHGMFRLD